MKKLLKLSVIILIIGLVLPVLAQNEAAAVSVDPLSDITTGTMRVMSDKTDEILELPLKHTDVEAEISGSISQVYVTQEFINPYKDPIEAIYVFPLPEDAAVDEMEMQIGDRIVIAEIKKREEARQIYETAKQQGQRTALLEQERPNIFTQSVANIMPGDNIKIHIRYFQILPYKDGRYSFNFPTVVGPRYIPCGGNCQDYGLSPSAPASQAPCQKDATQPGGYICPGDDANRISQGVKDADRITPPAIRPGYRSGHDISITVKINGGTLPITDLKSTNHQIAETLATGRCQTAPGIETDCPNPNVKIVSNAPLDSIPNKDFILEYTLAGSGPSFTLMTHKAKDQDGFFTLLAIPPLTVEAPAITPKEFFFVQDSSGSMSGEPIEKSKEALKYALQHLNPADTFYLIRFSNEVERFSQRPQENTPGNIEKAIKYVDTFNGNGGTEMLKGVREAIDTPLDGSRLRIVVFATDGYVGNEAEILSAIGQGAGKRVRFFPIGVGSSVNRYLIEEMARVGRGAASYLPLQKDATPIIEKFYNRIASPLLTDLTIDWQGLEVYDLTPGSLPDLFANQPLVISGRYKKPKQGEIKIKATEAEIAKTLLSGSQVTAKPYQYALAVNLPADEPGNSGLVSIWARAKIGEISSQMYSGEKPELVDQITKLGLDYHLVTQYTSFVAVEKKVVNEGGQTRRVDVPIPIPEGTKYEGFFGEADSASGVYSSKLLNSASRAGYGSGGSGSLGATVGAGLQYSTIVGWGTQDTKTTVMLILNIAFGFLLLIALFVLLPAGIIRKIRHRKDQPHNHKGWPLIIVAIVIIILAFFAYFLASYMVTWLNFEIY